MHDVICITEKQEVTACYPGPDVSRVSGTTPFDRIYETGVVSSPRPGLQHFSGPLRGGVVDQDDLPPAGVILVVESIQLLGDG